MFCEKCGNKLQDGERFCPVCGARVERGDSISEDEFSYEDSNISRRPEYMTYEAEPMDRESDPDVTAGMGYGYRQEEDRYDDPEEYPRKRSRKRAEDDDEDDWDREEKKEKITFAILGVIIVFLVAAIVAGVIFLVKSGDDKENERIPQLNEEMKEEMEQSQKNAEVTEEPTPETTPQATPEPTAEATPVPTQEVTPVPTQEVTPVPTQVVTPVPTQEVTPVPTQAPAASTDSEYIIADSSTRYLTNSDLSSLSEWEIRVARNEIYARHGRIFKTKEISSYFEGKSWYTPSIPADQFNNSYLNSIEIENLKFITNYEKAHNLNQ